MIIAGLNGMKPVREMLSRLRWDKNWAGNEFKIGYYDRLEQRILVVPFKEIIFPGENHFSFDVIDHKGKQHSLPYHRVKAIYRNGRLIWNRQIQ
jgi:uncharacterized protein (UPF0248 family)